MDQPDYTQLASPHAAFLPNYAVGQIPMSASLSHMDATTYAATSAGSSSSIQTPSTSLPHSLTQTISHSGTSECGTSQTYTTTSEDDDDHLIEHFYADFRPAHPFLPPRSDQEWDRYPAYLRLVMQCIGSHYCTSASSQSWFHRTQVCFSETLDQSIHQVQADLLFCIVSQVRLELCSSHAAFTRAAESALRLHMDSPTFAAQHGLGSLVIEDSLRRTWWELVIIDTLRTAFLRKQQLIVGEMNVAMLLPLDDALVAPRSIAAASPKSLRAFKDRIFASDNFRFPSSAYRIEAALALRRVVGLSALRDVDSDIVQSVDSCLTAWSYHLPADKTLTYNASGEVDHMLLQADMMIQSAIMLLHFPRSQLVSECPPSLNSIPCPQNSFSRIPTSSAHIHTVKALAASKSISDSAALRLPNRKDSPTYVCALSLAAMVQLAAGQKHGTSCLEQHRSRVTLILGVLKSLGQYYDLAARAELQIRPLAAHVFVQSHDGVDTHSMAAAPEMPDFAMFFSEDMWTQTAVEGLHTLSSVHLQLDGMPNR